jgi:hypothetical protein
MNACNRGLPRRRLATPEVPETEVRMRRIACIAVALVVSIALAPGTAGAAYTGHSTRAVTTCTGGSVITADGNAYNGQSREAQAWNDGDHETTCSTELTGP